VTVIETIPGSTWLDPEPNHPAVPQPIEISVVLPCLNEEASVVECISAIQDVLDELGKTYEVIVADNGSTDASVRLAGAAGARVVHESVPGYGSACRAGLRAAHGRYVVWGDADGTYDFSSIPDLIALLEDDADVALGNRLTGDLEPGSMPWTHRRLGTPFLTGAVNVLFGAKIGDVNCGIRAIKRGAYMRLDPQATGMEFASELLVKAIQHDLTIAQIPVPYRRRAGGEVKLRTFSDGWRHLRLVVDTWLRQGRRVTAPAPLVVLAGNSDVTIDLRNAGEPDEDRLRI
jgi:glycosyltransferase involved in cell wall biosynthesis